MSRAERRAMVDRQHRALAVTRQCELLAVSRSSVYRRPVEVSEEDHTIMAMIDRQYLARPFYGSRRMAAWLATQGYPVGRKRVQRLMRLMGLVAIYLDFRPDLAYQTRRQSWADERLKQSKQLDQQNDFAFDKFG
jgi:putative transposase